MTSANTLRGLIAICLSAASIASAHAQAQPNGWEAVKKGVAAHPSVITSAKCVLVDITTKTAAYAKWKASLRAPSEAQSGEIRERETWAFKGDKRFLQKAELADGKVVPEGPSNPSYTYIFDGRESFLIHTYGPDSSGQVNVGPAVANNLNPLAFGYQLDSVWFKDLFNMGRFELVGTEEDLKFGKLYRVKGNVPGKGTITLMLAEEYGFLATQVEQDIPGGQQRLRYELGSVGKVAGVWFPMRGKMSLISLNSSEPSILIDRELQVTNAEINNVADSLFVPVLRRGAEVRKGDRDYIVGANGEWINQIRSSQTASGLPIGWILWISLTSMAVIAFGAVARWRQGFLLPSR